MLDVSAMIANLTALARKGSDILIGGAGNDTFFAGLGNDIFEAPGRGRRRRTILRPWLRQALAP
jgi:hypothetical protein